MSAVAGKADILSAHIDVRYLPSGPSGHHAENRGLHLVNARWTVGCHGRPTRRRISPRLTGNRGKNNRISIGSGWGVGGRRWNGTPIYKRNPPHPLKTASLLSPSLARRPQKLYRLDELEDKDDQ